MPNTNAKTFGDNLGARVDRSSNRTIGEVQFRKNVDLPAIVAVSHGGQRNLGHRRRPETNRCADFIEDCAGNDLWEGSPSLISASETPPTEFIIRAAISSNARGDDDQIVPITDSALLSIELLKKGTLKVYEGFSHGMCTTHPDVINADLLAFIGDANRKR